MKTSFLKPGFEVIFSLALIAIIALPPVLRAQSKKDLEIKIENGDTTINGKNIKDLSPTERHDALKDIKHINGAMNFNGTDSTRKETFMEFRKRGPGNEHQPTITQDITIVKVDSAGNVVETRRNRQPRIAQTYAFNYRLNDSIRSRPRMREGGPMRPPREPMGMGRFEHRNSQNFDYTTTDAQGISTHINFRVSQPLHEDLQKITGVEGAKLEITDLNIVPEFSTGETLLMFTLPSKAVAEVFLKDGEGKLIWTEKGSGGSFSKSFPLPLNGIYYLHIKQGSSAEVKKIVKEE